MWIVSGRVYMERELLVISIQSRNFCAISLLEFVSKWLVSKRLCIKTTGYQRELFSGKRVPSLPELPWASQLFLNFLTKLCELFTWETVGSDRGVTCLAGVRVTTWANSSSYKHFSSPRRVTSVVTSVENRQLEHARTVISSWLAQRSHLFSDINACLSWLGWEGDSLSQNNFSSNTLMSKITIIGNVWCNVLHDCIYLENWYNSRQKHWPSQLLILPDPVSLLKLHPKQ